MHIWFVALGVMTSCGGGPRYADRSPPLVAATGCEVPVDEIWLASNGSTVSRRSTPPKSDGADAADAYSYSSLTVGTAGTHVENGLVVIPHEDFSLAPGSILPEVDRPAARRVGDIRTRDLVVDDATYQQILCAHTSGGDRGEQALCREAAEPVIARLLATLQAESASIQADFVDDVRCFGRSARRSLRVWCEGTAYLTRAREAGGCRGSAS